MERLAETERAAGRVGSRGGACVLVDGHVHLHSAFVISDALDRAAANLQAAARSAERAADSAGRSAAPAARGGAAPDGILMLTESAGVEAFESLARAAGGAVGPWHIGLAADDRSLYARKAGSELLLVAGRQVVTKERLEVLALCTRSGFRDGRPLREALEEVRSVGAVPVVPWGFGKWWFSRGRLLRDLLEASEPGELLLGDNGGRPRIGSEPAHFRAARSRGVPVLAGSDPLPFPEQVDRVGSYGSVLELALDGERPADRIQEHLSTLRSSPPTFGRRAPVSDFLSAQLRMQALVRGQASA